MQILHIWPFIFILFIPAIIFLYLLKQKAMDYPFSSLFLWKSAYQNLEASTPWEFLKRNLLMFIQILLILLFILAMTAPYLTKGGHSFENVILVIDNSGSMSSQYIEDGMGTDKTRLETAKEQAVDLLTTFPDTSRFTLITCSRQPSILLNNSTDKDEIKKAIEAIQAEDTKGDLNESVSLAASIAAEWKSYQAVFYTDTSINLDKVNGEVINLQGKGANGAIDYVSHKREEDGSLTVLVKVSNYGSKNIQTDVNLYEDNSIAQIQEVSLKPEESEILYFKGISQTVSYVKAEINEKDALINDNIAYDVIEGQKEKKILLVTKQNVFIEKAIQTVPNITLYKTNSAKNISDEETFDLYLFDGIIPTEIPKKGNLIFIHPNHSVEGLFTVKEKEKTGGYIKVSGKSALTKGISNWEFGVNKIQGIDKPDWADDFLKLEQDTVGFFGTAQNRKVAVLGFDIHESDVALQPEFPILIYRLMEQCLDTNMVDSSMIYAGEKIELYSQSLEEPIQIKKDGKEIDRFVSSGAKSVYDKLVTSGIYEIIQKSDESKEKNNAVLVVNFPVEESKTFLNKVTVTGGNNVKQQEQEASKKGGFDLRIPILIGILLLLMLEGFVYYRQGTFPKKDKIRRNMILTFRGLIVVLILLAIINPLITMKNRSASTIFLVDVSDSVSSQVKDEEAFIKETMKKLPKDEEVAVIAFGGDIKVEQFLSEQRLFSQLETTPITTATNLEKAVQGALSLFPSDAGKRLILLTDGNENEGSISKMTQSLKQEQVKVLVKELDTWKGNEVYLNQLTVPEKVNVGDTFQVKVEIESNVKTEAKLSLYAGDELKKTEEITLETGKNQFLFQDTQTTAGLKGYRAIVEAKKDTIKVNNEYVAFTKAKQGNRVLLVEGKKGIGAEMIKILEAANIRYTSVIPEGAPRTMNELMAYKSVLLLNVYGDDLPEGFMNNLESYVKDYAGGVVAIGGEDSFALGNWRDTPIEKVLPVNMDLQGEKEIPKTALALVIDRSGSMSEGNEAVTQLDLAKESAVSAMNAVRSTDEIGVLAFESSFEWVVPMKSASKKEEIEEGIYSIGLGGGTSIYPAISEAYYELSQSDAKIKHIILLTDGQDNFQEYDGLLDELNANHITLSTVAVGEGADQELLKWLAEEGKGRAYVTNMNSNIPRIFAKEVFLSSSSYLINEEFTPIITSNSKIIETANKGLPVMKGYIAVSPKESAEVHLMSNRKDPILASWQYGLGKTVAFTSDGENRWTGNYASWSDYPLFWKNIIEWTITDTENKDSHTSIEQSGTESIIRYETKDYNKSTQITATYTDEKGKGKEVALEAVSPGIYEGRAGLSDTGIYSINITKQQGEKVVSTENTATAVQYSNEYKIETGKNPLKGWINEVDGKWIKTGDDVKKEKIEQVASKKSLILYFLTLAIILFMAEIVLKRIQFDWSKLKVHEKKDSVLRSKVSDKLFEVQNKEYSKKQEKEVLDSKMQQETVKDQKKSSRTSAKGKKKANKKSKDTKEQKSSLDTELLLKKKNQR